MPITLIGVYAPASNREDVEKDVFYETLEGEIEAGRRNGATYVLGDFNARVQCRLDDQELAVVGHVFNPTNTNLEQQSPGVMNSRLIFIELWR